jgi:hypothetical protein
VLQHLPVGPPPSEAKSNDHWTVDIVSGEALFTAGCIENEPKGTLSRLDCVEPIQKKAQAAQKRDQISSQRSVSLWVQGEIQKVLWTSCRKEATKHAERKEPR